MFLYLDERVQASRNQVINMVANPSVHCTKLTPTELNWGNRPQRYHQNNDSYLDYSYLC